jgi:hypothetical protein
MINKILKLFSKKIRDNAQNGDREHANSGIRRYDFTACDLAILELRTLRVHFHVSYNE